MNGSHWSDKETRLEGKEKDSGPEAQKVGPDRGRGPAEAKLAPVGSKCSAFGSTTRSEICLALCESFSFPSSRVYLSLQ